MPPINIETCRGAGSAGIGGVVTKFQVELFPTQDQQVYGTGKIGTIEEAAHYLTTLGTLGRALLPGNAGIASFLFPTKFFGEEWFSIYSWYDNGMKQLKSGMTLLNEMFHQVLRPETARSFSMEIKSGTEYTEKNGIMAGRFWQVWNGFLMPEQCTVEVWTELLTLLKGIRDQGEGFVTIEILLFGGAISDIPPNATAYFWRQGLYNICVNLGVPRQVENAEEVFQRQRTHLEKTWVTKAKSFLEGAYYNYPMQGKAVGPSASFGGNLESLRQVKRGYDPHFVFKHPQSV